MAPMTGVAFSCSSTAFEGSLSGSSVMRVDCRSCEPRETDEVSASYVVSPAVRVEASAELLFESIVESGS